MSPSLSIYVAAAAFLVALYRYVRSSTRSSLPLPPGPKPVPILGNIRDLTAKELWLPATQWAKQYGDVVYLHLLGQGLVFVNSPEAAIDLLDKKGAIYSDKPHLVMAGDLCGCKNMVAFTGYNDQSKRQRQLLHKAFGAPVIPSYHPAIEVGTRDFLRRLVADPAAFPQHLRRYAGGLTLGVVYGYEPKAKDDEFLTMAEDCVNILSEKIASGGGIWPVDVIPALQYLPDWVPGTAFKRKAREWKKKMEEMVDSPYEFVKNEIKAGTYRPSFCSNLLEDTSIQAGQEGNFEFDLKWTANSMYSGSIDTTITTVSNFILAVLSNPSVLKKAQEELDSVVGQDRLPTFADRPDLPYVEAIYMEALRWGCPVPLNLPHRLMEDDVYKGMRIPKGSLVFGNSWAMLRDPTMYPDPESFNPDRFMSPMSPDLARRLKPQNYVFGFGRRQCPGSNLVDSSIWLLIAGMLSTLDISKAVDEWGKEVDPKVDYVNPIFRNPGAFECGLKPRGERSLAVLGAAS